MQYLRIIDPNRWRNKKFYDSDTIADLATTEHGISVWQVDDNNSNLEDVLLAMSMRRSKFEPFYYIVLKDTDIKKMGLSFNKELGETRYIQMKENHRNIELFNLCDLIKMSRYIMRRLKKEENLNTFELEEQNSLFEKKAKQNIFDAKSLQGTQFASKLKHICNFK